MESDLQKPSDKFESSFYKKLDNISTIFVLNIALQKTWNFVLQVASLFL